MMNKENLKCNRRKQKWWHEEKLNVTENYFEK